jgi:predicted Zn finger-like uncharacterized protein
MLIRCPDCRTEYAVQYDEGGMVPGARVRCPRCRVVFPLPGPPAREEPRRAPNLRRISDPQLARRLARAMLSEIVLHRRTERDAALEEGTLLARFGPAISAAYRLYGEKVAPELPGQRRIFREAVNDIVGDGRPVL